MRLFGGLIDRLAKVGDRTLDLTRQLVLSLAFVGEVATTLGGWFTGRTRFRRRAFLSAFETSGPRILPLLLPLALLLGLVIAASLGPSLAKAQVVDKLPAILVAMTLREGAPLLAALVLAGQVAPAFASELAAFQRTPDRADGPAIPSAVLPLALATSATLPLTYLLVAAAMLAGAVVGGSGLERLPLDEYLESTAQAIRPLTLLGGMLKCVAFGAAVGLCACNAGVRFAMRPPGGPPGEPSAVPEATEIGEVTRRALGASLFWILLLDGLFGRAFEGFEA